MAYGSIMPNVVDMRYETAVKQLSEDFTMQGGVFFIPMMFLKVSLQNKVSHKEAIMIRS